MMMTMMRSVAVAAALAATAAVAQEATQIPADTNQDGLVTRKEFVDHMGKTWDDSHRRMMGSDRSMQAGMMDQRQYNAFGNDLMGAMEGRPGRSPNPNPGLIGGGGTGRITMNMKADADRDGRVSRDEFMQYMGHSWDEQHARMMKSDPGMKAGMMDGRHYRDFAHGMHGAMVGEPGRSPNPNPGKVGGG